VHHWLFRGRPRPGCAECWFRPFLYTDDEVEAWQSAEKENECLQTSGCHCLTVNKVPTKITVNNTYFINLERRADRYEEITLELQNHGFTPATHFKAWDGQAHSDELDGCWGDPPYQQCAGQLGCQMSHVTLLELAIQKKLPHIAIFEDDFRWRPSWKSTGRIKEIIEEAISRLPEWDVITLGLNLQSWDAMCDKADGDLGEGLELVRVTEAQTTSAYIVHNRFLQRLRDAIAPENCHVKLDYHTAIDQCWKELMGSSLWFAFQPQPGFQGASYSDIEMQMVDYSGLMNRRLLSSTYL